MLKNDSLRLLWVPIIALLTLALSSCGIADTLANTAALPGGTPAKAAAGTVSVSFIDVGQADSTLIQTENRAMLIDAGERANGPAIIDYLISQGVAKLDVVVATHPHADHIGGFPAIFDAFDVGTVVMPDAVHTTATFERFLDAVEASAAAVVPAVAGDIIELDDVVLTIVAPNGGDYHSLNNYSVVIRMMHGDNAFIFAGDAEALSEGEMLQNGHNLSANVLKVGHHGSVTSTSQAFLNAVRPSYAVISLGADNRYGHPHNDVTALLQNNGVRIYRTDMHGTVKIVSDGVALYIQTERD